MSSSTRKVTVEDATSSHSASPSPSPPAAKSALPTSSKPHEGEDDTADPVPVDQPIDSLGGEEHEDEDEDEWDPAEERLPGEAEGKGKGKGKAKEGEGEGEAHPWQAVWSPEQNAWYFWNTKTGEVSWTNPLDPSTSTSASETPNPPLPNEAPPLPAEQPPYPSSVPAASSSSSNFGGIPEIDPALAFLLSPAQRAGLGGPSDGGIQSAAFNARTGRFTPQGYEYNVDHLDEYNRSKRMNNHYFDVEKWERERAEENAKRKREEESGVGGKKKITKKDMERFKKKAQEKKMRSQAWLRE
ncbi:hypothetical protein CI109_103612 [Kwoniella shandongensis]|uniref:Uncharacterized protein n=1 Tax=Kwoniella shandongensis TaxID=1734106 RepID=A0A5M6C7T3_9TREE|nr:uncharacterized protein CI109_000696 [Kwoniella shandongensis]KAA5531124.1 hypothetical protein CI109_000696 [Kwoniella shandongensis]